MKFESNALVMLIGIAGCGKTQWAVTKFGQGAVVESDHCRELVCGDANNQQVNAEAFALFHNIIDTRLKAGVFTVADATNLTDRARKGLWEIANRHQRPVHYVVFTTPLGVAQRWNAARERVVPEHVLNRHQNTLDDLGPKLRAEKPASINKVDARKPKESADIIPVYPDSHEADDWWVISDVHGCGDELLQLLGMIPSNAKVAFVGDFVDRGPKNKLVLTTVRSWIEMMLAFAVPGNHCWKAYRKIILNRNVQITHGLAETLQQIGPDDIDFIGDLPHYLHLTKKGDDRIVTVCHAGLPFQWIGRHDRAVQGHCFYGETDGSTDPETGYPNRTYGWTHTWVEEGHICVFGHTPTREVNHLGELGNCVNIDTGCAFGGKLTAYNPFTKEVLEVPALDTYCDNRDW